MAKPSEILRKGKADDKDGDKDPKQGDKSNKRNALVDFIAKHKK